jgi:Helicase associated domain
LVIDGCQLGSWVITQRGKHAKGTLSAEHAKRLEQLRGWIWGALANRWDENFCKLEQYVKSTGSARMPNS